MPEAKAVLFDRDGTLVADVPRNRDAARLEAMPQAREALRRLRSAGYLLGVVTNQPGIAEGWLDANGLAALHEQVEILVGPIDGWFVCAHAENDRCGCRKPQPGLIFQAAAAFGVHPRECIVVGDVASDLEAAHRAGARGVMVPTSQTRRDEIAAAPSVASDLAAAAAMILGA